jgi:hypothetical protein
MPRALSRKIINGIALLASGEARHVKQAAEKVGVTREALSRALQRDDGQRELLKGLNQHRSIYSRMQAQRAIQHLAKYARSEDVKLRASQWIETTLGMGQRGEGSQSNGGGAGSGGTFVLNLVLKSDAVAQIGAQTVQSATLIEQRVDAPTQSEPGRYLAKVVSEPGRGARAPGGRDGDR